VPDNEERPATIEGSAGHGAAGADSAVRDSEVDRLSNRYVAEYAAHSPMMATFLGVPGDPDRLDDLSPAGLADGHALVTSTLATITAAESTGPEDDIARDVLVERLEVELDHREPIASGLRYLGRAA